MVSWCVVVYRDDGEVGRLVAMELRNGLRGLVVVVAFCCGGVALGQSQVGVYGTVGAENSGLSGQSWTAAGTVGLYFGLRGAGPLSVAVDGRGDFSKDLTSVLVGPRLALHFPAFPVKPYGELLLGAVYFSSQNNGKKDASDLAYRFVGGADVGVFPHLDWRVLEVSYGGGLTELNKNIHMTTISSGVVVRF